MRVTIGDSRWRLRWGRGWLLRGALSTLLRVKGEEEGGGKGLVMRRSLMRMQMGRGSPRYVHRRQAEADDPPGAGLWGEGDGTDSCGVDAEYVVPPLSLLGVGV